MSTAQHTPGRLVHNTMGYPQCDIKSESGRNVANTWGLAVFKSADHLKKRTDEDRANTRRLVACWNACDGITTEQVEQIPGLMGHRQSYHEMQRQRDELLAALQGVVRVADRKTDEFDAAHAAIAKATGADHV